jgi:hypothetical protein
MLAPIFLQRDNISAALLCLESYFEWCEFRLNMSAESMLQYLHLFREYARIFSAMIRHRDLLGDADVRKLLGLRQTSETQFSVSENSFLWHKLPRAESIAESLTLIGYDLIPNIQKHLTGHLIGRVTKQELTAGRAEILSPCLSHSLTKSCPRMNCPEAHLDSPVSATQYNQRVVIHLEQIAILDMLSPFYYSEGEFTRQRK